MLCGALGFLVQGLGDDSILPDCRVPLCTGKRPPHMFGSLLYTDASGGVPWQQTVVIPILWGSHVVKISSSRLSNLT